MTVFFQKIFAFFFSVIIALFPSLAGPQAQINSYSAENDILTVCLSSNPTTGYSWDVEVSDENVIAYPAHSYKQDDTSGKFFGAGGTDTFIFKSVGEGSFTVTFVYSQSWDKNSKGDVRTLSGVVDADGVITVTAFE